MLKIPDEAKKLLEGKNFANLATVMRDGSPQVSPVWVDVEGDMILVNTAEGRLKFNNIKRDSRVALSVYDQENPYRKVLIRGKVVEITKQGADAHIDKMSMKYRGIAKYQYHQPGIDRIILKIEPFRIGF